MAGDFSAGIVVGLYLKRKEHRTSITKYNEDTGVPYQKTVIQHYWETADGRRVTFDIAEICGVKDTELQLFKDYIDRCVVGCPVVKVATSGCEMAACLPSEDAITDVQRNVELQLQALGCDLATTAMVVVTLG